jgi:hypothetical protein
MPEELHGPTDPVHPSVRRERTDADVWGVLLFGVILIVVAVVAHVVLWGMFRGFQHDEAARRKRNAPPPVAKNLPRFPQGIPQIPEPQLQVSDVDDMNKLRKREEGNLNAAPGWVDRKAGVAHVPIEEAMRLLEDPDAAAANGAGTRPVKGKGGKK